MAKPFITFQARPSVAVGATTSTVTPASPATSQVPGLIVGFALGFLGMLAVVPFVKR